MLIPKVQSSNYTLKYEKIHKTKTYQPAIWQANKGGEDIHQKAKVQYDHP